MTSPDAQELHTVTVKDRVMQMVGNVASRIGSPSIALRIYESQLEKYPNDPQLVHGVVAARFRLSRSDQGDYPIEERKDHFREILKVLNPYLKGHKDDIFARNAKIVAEFLLADYQEQGATAAIDRWDRLADYQEQRATAVIEIREIIEAAGKSPSLPYLHYNHAAFLMSLGRWDEAGQELDLALAPTEDGAKLSPIERTLVLFTRLQCQEGRFSLSLWVVKRDPNLSHLLVADVRDYNMRAGQPFVVFPRVAPFQVSTTSLNVPLPV